MNATRSIAPRLICICALLLTGLLSGARLNAAHAGRTNASAVQACSLVHTAEDRRPAGTTTTATLEQGYRCLLAHYVEGKALDHRVLLRGALNGLIRFLRQQGFSLKTPPVMSLQGDANADYQVFLGAFKHVTSQILALDAVQSALIDVALLSMTQSLYDNHTSYVPQPLFVQALDELDDSKPQPTFGIITSPITTTAPLYITDVLSGTAASASGLLPGDTIVTLNGQPPFADGQGTLGLASLVLPQAGRTLAVTIRRPVTKATIAVSLVAQTLKLPDIEARLLLGTIAYVKLYAFTQHASADVLAAIARLQHASPLRGVVLDLRGNAGGYGEQAVRILSAFTHGTVLYYEVQGDGKHAPQRANDRVPLLHLPLAVLIDSGSASSSEIVAAAVRDLALGTLIGERSAGALGGADFYALNDGSGMEITVERVLGPRAELVDGVGVRPDIPAITRAGDLSAGNDPGITRALTALAAASPAA